MSTLDYPKPSRRERIPGHPGLYRTPSGKVVARFRDRTGKVRSRTYRNLTLADRAKNGVDAIDRSERTATPRTPFRQYATEWISTYRGRRRGGAKRSTIDSYADTLRVHAIPFFGTIRLDQIDPPLLKRYIAHLERQGYASATIHRFYAPVRALLATAYEDGILHRPVNIRIVLEHADAPQRRPALTGEQTAALLAEIPAEHLDLALLYATTGARLSEPLGLRWRDITTDGHGYPVVSFPRSKTDAGLKPIRLTPGMAQAFTRRRAAADAGPDELIFPTVRGGELDGRNWRQSVFKAAAERAGIPWATPHMLRHGVATAMAATGAEAYDIARHLRHADGGRLAMQTYIHPDAPNVAFLDDHVRARREPTN
jgi:integrase